MTHSDGVKRLKEPKNSFGECPPCYPPPTTHYWTFGVRGSVITSHMNLLPDRFLHAHLYKYKRKYKWCKEMLVTFHVSQR